MDWKTIVKTVAPVLGTALGGPLGGAATKFIADKLLGDPNASQDQIEAFMAGASPETLAKLKELDLQFKTEMRRLDVDLEKLQQADRQDARSLAKVDMRPHMVISAIYTAMYGLVLWCLLTGKVTVARCHSCRPSWAFSRWRRARSSRSGSAHRQDRRPRTQPSQRDSRRRETMQTKCG